MSDKDKDPRRVGRDETNLAEFSITLLTDLKTRAGLEVVSVPAMRELARSILGEPVLVPTSVPMDPPDR
jgi:hypothetical protein